MIRENDGAVAINLVKILYLSERCLMSRHRRIKIQSFAVICRQRAFLTSRAYPKSTSDNAKPLCQLWEFLRERPLIFNTFRVALEKRFVNPLMTKLVREGANRKFKWTRTVVGHSALIRRILIFSTLALEFSIKVSLSFFYNILQLVTFSVIALVFLESQKLWSQTRSTRSISTVVALSERKITPPWKSRLN